MNEMREDMTMIEVAEEDVEDRHTITEMENPLWRPLTGRNAILRSELHAHERRLTLNSVGGGGGGGG